MNGPRESNLIHIVNMCTCMNGWGKGKKKEKKKITVKPVFTLKLFMKIQ